MTILPAPEAQALPDLTVQSSTTTADAVVPRIVFGRGEHPQAVPVIATWDAYSRALYLNIRPGHVSAEMVELLNGTARDVPASLRGATIDCVDRLPVDVPVIGWSPEKHRLLVDERHLSVQAAAAISAELSDPRILPPEQLGFADAVDQQLAEAGRIGGNA